MCFIVLLIGARMKLVVPCSAEILPEVWKVADNWQPTLDCTCTYTSSPCHLGQQAGGQVGLLGGEVEANEMAHETHHLPDTTQSMHGTAIWITSLSTANLNEHSHSTCIQKNCSGQSVAQHFDHKCLHQAQNISCTWRPLQLKRCTTAIHLFLCYANAHYHFRWHETIAISLYIIITSLQ